MQCVTFIKFKNKLYTLEVRTTFGIIHYILKRDKFKYRTKIQSSYLIFWRGYYGNFKTIGCLKQGTKQKSDY